METSRPPLVGLVACGCLLGVCLIAFNLLYLFVPAGWAPIYDFAPNIRTAYARVIPAADFALTPQTIRRASLALQAGMWLAFLAALACAAKLRHGVAAKAAFKVVTIVAVFASLALILTPPTLSKDLYHYALHGRMIITRGLNPYVTAASALAGDPLAPFANWLDFPTHYGPVFTGLSIVAVFVGGGGPVGTAIAFKGMATAFGALAARATVSIAEREGRDGLIPLVLIAWNPLVLLETAGSGHNEMVMIGLALLGVDLVRKDRTGMGFLFLVASAHVKWVTVALGGLVAIACLRATDGARARARLLATIAAVAAVVTVAVYAPFWTGGDSIAATRRLLVEGRGGTTAMQASRLIPFGLVVAIAVVVVARRGQTRVLEMAALISAAFVAFVFPWKFPWYLLPAVAFLSVGPFGRVNRVLLATVTASSMFLMTYWALIVERL